MTASNQNATSWTKFCDYIIKCNRFFLPRDNTFIDMLSCIGEATSYRHPIDRPLYRGRVSKSNVKVEYFEPCGMLNPNHECSSDGRANVCGIPVLYTAESESTVVAELRGWKGATIQIVTLKPMRELSLVNLSRCDAFITPYGQEDSDQADTLRDLMRHLNEAFSKPYSDSDAKLSYVPTQYVASFYKAAGFDGIRYSSAMDTDGHNVAIFETHGSVEPLKTIKCLAIEVINYQMREYTPCFKKLGCSLTAADEPTDH